MAHRHDYNGRREYSRTEHYVIDRIGYSREYWDVYCTCGEYMYESACSVRVLWDKSKE